MPKKSLISFSPPSQHATTDPVVAAAAYCVLSVCCALTGHPKFLFCFSGMRLDFDLYTPRPCSNQTVAP